MKTSARRWTGPVFQRFTKRADSDLCLSVGPARFGRGSASVVGIAVTIGHRGLIVWMPWRVGKLGTTDATEEPEIPLNTD